MDDAFKPYLMACKQILQGQYVPDLEEIRKQCNDNYIANSNSETDEKLKKHQMELITCTFVANAENNILKGSKVEEQYKDLGIKENHMYREGGIKILENIVNTYLQ